MYLPHVVVDYSTARNVLEHEIRECKIKLIRRNDGQIYAVVLVDDGVAARSECLSSQSDHLSANVHAVNFAKDACQRLCDPASATPYLKDFHSSGISTLADVHHVVEDVAFHRLFTGRKNSGGAPLLVPWETRHAASRFKSRLKGKLSAFGTNPPLNMRQEGEELPT